MELAACGRLVRRLFQGLRSFGSFYFGGLRSVVSGHERVLVVLVLLLLELAHHQRDVQRFRGLGSEACRLLLLQSEPLVYLVQLFGSVGDEACLLQLAQFFLMSPQVPFLITRAGSFLADCWRMISATMPFLMSGRSR